MAGVPYAVGREGHDAYDKPLAGRREVYPGRHQFPPFVSPYRRGPNPPKLVEGAEHGYAVSMCAHNAGNSGPEPDQDAEPTMSAPPGERPDAGASELEPDGRADSPDVIDTDAEQDLDQLGQPHQGRRFD